MPNLTRETGNGSPYTSFEHEFSALLGAEIPNHDSDEVVDETDDEVSGDSAIAQSLGTLVIENA